MAMFAVMLMPFDQGVLVGFCVLVLAGLCARSLWIIADQYKGELIYNNESGWLHRHSGEKKDELFLLEGRILGGWVVVLTFRQGRRRFGYYKRRSYVLIKGAVNHGDMRRLRVLLTSRHAFI